MLSMSSDTCIAVSAVDIKFHWTNIGYGSEIKEGMLGLRARPKNRRGVSLGGWQWQRASDRPAICSLIVRDGLYFTLYGVRQWRGKRPELTNHFKCPNERTNELPIARAPGGGMGGNKRMGRREGDG